MDDATSEARACEICGVLIRPNNTYGICTDQGKPACIAARRRKRLGLPEPGEKTCEICGKPLRLDNKTGICSDRGTECARVRKRMDRGAADPRGHRHLLVIKPGDTFGLWTALEEYSTNGKTVRCRCACGRVRSIRASALTRGETRSCGRHPYGERMRNAPYLAAGTTWGLLTALEDARKFDDRIRFRCSRDGTEKLITAYSVKTGATKSCGCLTATLGGFSRHPLHELWNSMIQRCTNPNHRGYENYGGRPDAEITVCDRWRTDPWGFAEDILRKIGPRPEGKDDKGRALYEFDRINNNRGYWCGRCAYCASRGQFTINVRWSDKETQAANRRNIADLSRDLAAARGGQSQAVRPKRAPVREVSVPELTMDPLF